MVTGITVPVVKNTVKKIPVQSEVTTDSSNRSGSKG